MYTQQNTCSAQQLSFTPICAPLQHISGIIYGNLKAVHTKLQAEYTVFFFHRPKYDCYLETSKFPFINKVLSLHTNIILAFNSYNVLHGKTQEGPRCLFKICCTVYLCILSVILYKLPENGHVHINRPKYVTVKHRSE